MKSFNTMSELEEYIQNQINDTLIDEVHKEVKKVLQEHVIEDVYGTYNPIKYNRRGNGGGLIADDNIVGEIINDGLLQTKDIAMPSNSVLDTPYNTSDSTMFSRWINDGNVPNIFNNKDYSWQHPRPFVNNTIEDLEQNKQHYEALVKGLKKRKII